MPITGGIASAVAISGLDGTASTSLVGEIAEPVIITGLPGFIPQPVVPTTTPDSVRARVLDEDGVFIAHLPHAKGLRWTDEHNSPGSGSVDYRRYDDLETAHPTLWQAGNQVVISVGSRDVFRLVLDADGGYQIDDTGQRIDTWAGLGALGVLNSGMIEPEYGWRAEATDERSFDYGSNPAIGGWLVASEWRTPVGKLVRKSWRWWYHRRHLPKGFPTKKAYWLWYKNPDAKATKNETCYFRSSFTLTGPARVKFWVCGDDTLTFQLDGEERITTGPGGWKKASTLVMNLSAGTHYVAAKVTNTPGSGGNANRSGFLCAIGQINGDGDVVKWLRRSNPSTWTVRRQLSAPPGWFPAQIAKRLVDEQIGRGCAGHAGITYGFSTTKDSAGVGWTGRKDMGMTVETLGLDWMQEIVEQGVDVSMTPALRLNMWRRRGVDRSKTVRIDQGDARVLAESGTQRPAVRNVLHARARTGWVERTAPASIAAYGRRESGISLGSSRSPSQTANALASLITDLAYPPQTIEVELSGVAGPQPYRDYDVADWISFRASGKTTWGRYRVMSIGGEVTEAGLPKWTLQLYED